MLPRALEAAIMSRSWDRIVEGVVGIFSDFKGECCSN